MTIPLPIPLEKYLMVLLTVGFRSTMKSINVDLLLHCVGIEVNMPLILFVSRNPANMAKDIPDNSIPPLTTR